MNNYKIIIDASHGGEDVGLLLYNIPEKNITLDISKYMYQQLKHYNIPVAMVREQDETILPKERIKKITEMYGDHKYVIVISNHIHTKQEYEIIYGIHQLPNLSNRISSYLIREQENVVCHCKRLGSNPRLDYYNIHRDIANMEVIRISYPFTQNRGDLDKSVDKIVAAIYEYIGGKVETDIYQVESGDTMWNVAKKFNLSLDELKWLNGFSDNLLRTGDMIKVKKPKKDLQYIVGSGENLYQISKKFDVEIEELMEYNQMKSNLIQIGQIIKIPEKHLKHIVHEGENLYQISKYYQKDVGELIEKNKLIDQSLQVGDFITI